jgi:hypothetical protein
MPCESSRTSKTKHHRHGEYSDIAEIEELEFYSNGGQSVWVICDIQLQYPDQEQIGA